MMKLLKDDDRPSDVILAELIKEYNVYGIHCPKFINVISIILLIRKLYSLLILIVIIR